MTDFVKIKQVINQILKNGLKVAVFPMSEIGLQVVRVCEELYGIDVLKIDNNFCLYRDDVYPIDYLNTVMDYGIVLASKNQEIYEELLELLKEHNNGNNSIYEPFLVKKKKYSTIIGKYSYGPICRDHQVIKSIGAFCSFADGVEAVMNHQIDYISTHMFLFAGNDFEDFVVPYEEYGLSKVNKDWYFEGVYPKRAHRLHKRSVIGNDVWLGKNVIITNGANIGNGVIAAAGAVITKDVPDYAIVAGVPAKIIRYRYSQEQIDKLLSIAWWNWSDELIRERYDDFYLPVEQFLEKYYTRK